MPIVTIYIVAIGFRIIYNQHQLKPEDILVAGDDIHSGIKRQKNWE